MALVKENLMEMSLPEAQKSELVGEIQTLLCDQSKLDDHLRTQPTSTVQLTDAEELEWLDVLDGVIGSDARLSALTLENLLRLKADPVSLQYIAHEVNCNYLSGWNFALSKVSPSLLEIPKPSVQVIAALARATATGTPGDASLGFVPEHHSTAGSPLRVFDWEWENEWEELDWEQGESDALATDPKDRVPAVFRVQAFARRGQKPGYWKVTFRGQRPVGSADSMITLTIAHGPKTIEWTRTIKLPERGVVELIAEGLGDPNEMFGIEKTAADEGTATINTTETPQPKQTLGSIEHGSISLQITCVSKGSRWKSTEEASSGRITRAFYNNWYGRHKDGYRSVAQRLSNWARRLYSRDDPDRAQTLTHKAAEKLFVKAFVMTDVRDYAHFSKLVLQKAKGLYLDQETPNTDLPSDFGPGSVTADAGPFDDEHFEWVREAIAKLPSKYGSIVEQMYFHGSTYQEIHERTKVPMVTLRQQVRRALILLREAGHDRFKDSRDNFQDVLAR
jgi:DNA-directed RNA polymerase specialized sigma24 family protein